MDKSRRDFLKQATLASGAAGLMHFLPPSLAKAMAIDPAKGSTFMDAEHIVFLMQENRSFDHAFGTLQGVRGYDNPRAIDLPSGRPVWAQTNDRGETFAPFRLDIHNTKATWMSSLPHSWTNQVDARNDGFYDKWLQAKASGHEDYQSMPLTMGYHNREDIPFYYAMADAFTVCDHNFCSSLTGTTPNRLYFWSGTIREKARPDVMARVYNGDADYERQASWKTFPERLEEENISWKVYQNEISVGTGLEGEADSWLANFTDNPLEFFEQYKVKLSPEFIANLPSAKLKIETAVSETRAKLETLAAGSKEQRKEAEKLKWLEQALKTNIHDQATCTTAKFDALDDFEKNIHRKAFANNRDDKDYHELSSFTYNDNGTTREVKIPKGDVLHQFRKDVDGGQLPSVSWLVAPENFSDHPSSAWYGSWYISEVMNILTKNPEVWKKTIFIITYDENDGYFDHLPPFVVPHPSKKETGAVSKGIDTAVEYVIGPGQQSSEKDDLRESPIGLGYRVPMIIASPWSRGGWVNSQVFDHTSSLQFLEKFLTAKTGKKITEPNISEWRRTICGDLTSVFRPYNGEQIKFPEPVKRQPFIQGIHEAQFKKLPDDFVKIDTSTGEIKQRRLQEKGTRPSNALPYQPHADLSIDRASGNIAIQFRVDNSGTPGVVAGTPFIVYTIGKYNGAIHKPRNYAVAAGEAISDSWSVSGFDDGTYHLRVYGPNGFYREFKGKTTAAPFSVSTLRNGLTDKGKKAAIPSIALQLSPVDADQVRLSITDNSYGAPVKQIVAIPGNTATRFSADLERQQGWYDFSVTSPDHPEHIMRYAGRIETGKDSITDPLMGGVAKQGS
ncbi:MAG: phospholipase C, phosphocholine-specific [Chitinophagaceae bacterium]|nr:MAG: phospholipase C, phosphocholine-specific [Chitinophagaceae bacterium]